MAQDANAKNADTAPAKKVDEATVKKADDAKKAAPKKMTAEQQRLAAEEMVKGDALGSGFLDEIDDCATGVTARILNDLKAKGSKSLADAGPYCLAVIEHTANVDINPELIKKYPEQRMLIYPAAMAGDKGYNDDFASAAQVLKLYTQMGNDPQARERTYGSAPSAKKPEKSWVINPNNAVIMNFISTVKDGREGKPVPVITSTYEEMVPTLNQCFETATYQEKNHIKMGSCADIGRQAGAMYLKKAASQSK